MKQQKLNDDLIYAINGGILGEFKKALIAGGKANATDKEGTPAYKLAYMSGHLPMTKILQDIIFNNGKNLTKDFDLVTAPIKVTKTVITGPLC